jgi:hypothetical protein
MPQYDLGLPPRAQRGGCFSLWKHKRKYKKKRKISGEVENKVMISFYFSMMYLFIQFMALI